MKDSFVAVLDSGIGGLSVLNELIKVLPNEKYVYLGDNGNAPYGNKSIDELLTLSRENIDLIKNYPIKCLVLGCNTLSVNIINEIEQYAQIKTFGVFPPVNKILTKEKTLLISTVRTAKNFVSNKNFHILALKNVVTDIETNINNLSKINIDKNLCLSEGFFVNKKGYYDTVILGCTHYVFIKNKIFDHFCPRKIISGNEFTAIKVRDFLLEQDLLVKHKRFEINFIGKYAKINEKFFSRVVKRGNF